MDVTYHAAQDIIYVIHNPAPSIPLVKLGHVQKEALNNLASIFRKEKAPAVPLRVLVKEVGQSKLQEMNQEGTEMKRKFQSNSVTNAEPLRVPIVES